MSSVAAPPRVQFVVSGKFIALLLIAAGLLGGGYYWYSQQQQTQKRFRNPPYFVNRGASIIRACKQCLDLGKLKAQQDWKIGKPTEISATEQRWFLAVEDPPTPVEVAGVLMLPVHPALGDNPALGFDKSQVVLVLYQSMQRMAAIEQPSPQPPPPIVQPTSADRTQTPALNMLRIGNFSWRIEVPTDNEWHDTGIPVIAVQRVIIRPTNQQTYGDGEGYWSAGFGEYKFDVPEDNEESDREFDQELTEDQPFVAGPEWMDTLTLRVRQHSAATFSLDVEMQFPELNVDSHYRGTAEPWEEHLQRHQQARLRAEALLKKP